MATQREFRLAAWLVAFALLVFGPLGCSSASGGSSATEAADSGGSSGDGAAPRGCGQGTSCTAGSDLPAPPPDQGIQLETPDNAIVVQPNQEVFLCYYRTLPNTAAVDIGKMQSWMTLGSSHHFIAYEVGTGAGLAGGRPQPDGTLVSCPFGGGTWLYATSTAGEIIEMKMPDGVGLPFPAATQVMLNMHFINSGSKPAYPKIKMNFLYAKNVQYKAAAMVSFNVGINIPPATSSGPGTQTVSGTCTAPVGSKFFAVTTHTHKHGTESDVNYVSGGQTTNIVKTTDWEHPDVGLWNAPNFLTVQQGDKFTYSCAYSNPSSSAVVVGDTAATNEMCMAIGYYFPAGTTNCN
jgi:Copper type II ascorbate-dependent monooxygenase, C-terminal domain